MENKNRCTAYLLWLFGGLFGLHLIYLKRYHHVVFFWGTFGLFGLETFRNIFKISEYLDEVNKPKEYVQVIKANMRSYKKPKFSLLKFAGELLFGYVCSLLGFCIFPTEIYTEPYTNTSSFWKYIICHGVVPCFISFGIYIVGNIGNEKRSLKWCLIGSEIGSALYLNDISSQYPILIAAIISNWKGKSWRPVNEKQISFFKACFLLTTFWFLYSSGWIFSIYQNGVIESKDAEKIRIKDAINNFFTSPAWTETKETINQLYKYYQQHGWEKLWKEFQTQLDPEGESNAFKILGVEPGASEKKISSAYKKLVLQWHPDKHKTNTEQASKKFMEIQKAYETLSKISKRRNSKNKKSV